MDRSRVVAVIPAYNEASTITSVVSAAMQHVAVIVVDDGSADDTAAMAEAAGAIVVRNVPNRGYEAALNRGLKEALSAGFEYIVTMDADGEHDPKFLAQFATALLDQKIPLVLGRRPRKQRWAEIIMGLYVRTRFGVHDILCGMKGYRADLVQKYSGFDSGGSVGTALAISAIRGGYDFCEIPINGTHRGDAPRFASRWHANMQIMTALGKLIAQDIGAAKHSRTRHGDADG